MSPAPSSLTYEPHYGLAEKPFSLAANPRFLYKGPTHRMAFDRLLAGIRRREGLIVLTGEVGTGKTTVCRAVIDALDRRTFSAFVPDPFVTREDLLKAALVSFGVVSADDIKAGRLHGTSRQDLSHLLYEFLHSIAPLDAFAVIVVDEAQNLSLPVLEEIRILTELESGERMLQVVLVGQPELRAHLQLPEMRQLNQRVSVHAELSPLDAEGVAAYVAHRLEVAAHGPGGGVAFTPDALDAIWRASAGVPRLVNKICDRALEDGHAVGVTAIGTAQVTAALNALALPPVAEAPPDYALPTRLAPVASDAAPSSPPAAPVTHAPHVMLAPEGDDPGLDAFAAENPAPPAPPAPHRPPTPPTPRVAVQRPRALPTLFEPHGPALGRTSDQKTGWLTKLWRASIYVLALGGAIATSGVLDGRAAPWNQSLTPPLPPAPALSSRDTALSTRGTRPSTAADAMVRADIEVFVTAPDPGRHSTASGLIQAEPNPADALPGLLEPEIPSAAQSPDERDSAPDAGSSEAGSPDAQRDGLDQPANVEP